MKILVIGSGPIVIGQAAEFDYSGSQACRALKEEGHEIVLVNNNPATIMTDVDFADRTYLEPLVLETLVEIIKKEKPEGLLATLGGQTGLNLAVQLGKSGALEKHNVKLLGTSLESIQMAEDRGSFKDLMNQIGEPVLESRVVRNLNEAEDFLKKMGLPLVIRPAYTLGGSGGGFANDVSSFIEIVKNGLQMSPVTEVLLEKSIYGWKELEYEVMRDGAGNCITVCNMENLDPMGVHTGDSIVVAPSQTLTDKEYHKLRTSSLKIIDSLDIKGGCNVQFALNEDGEYIVIEVNPRVSRSSALASKATGYPIARVAALIASGKTLPEIRNKVTGTTTACFEPALDYIVTKIPRWPFDKFPKANRELGVQMKATGEVMSIGRNFKESFIKALGSLEMPGKKLFPFAGKEDDFIKSLLKTPTDQRIYAIFESIFRGWETEEICSISGWNSFFIEELKELLRLVFLGELGTEEQLQEFFDRDDIDSYTHYLGEETSKKSRDKRSFRMVDTCASEFESFTRYYYGTDGEDSESEKTKSPIVVVGGGPIRIGQGIEFDCCCVHALQAIRESGHEAVMINNNPETVSTDFDFSDQLFFEPLNHEDVLKVVDDIDAKGVIVQFGGQTSINMANQLEKNGVNLLGTPLSGIDIAEDRKKIDRLLSELGVNMPKGYTVDGPEDLEELIEVLSFPVLVRPSFVLGGRAMTIAYTKEDVVVAVKDAYEQVDGKNPILIDEYILGKELEIDLVCDGTDIYVPGVMEHIERAGVHSGDSMAVFPSFSLDEKTINEIVEIGRKIAFGLECIGMLNIQYIMSEGSIYVLEVNPRASRTVPFLAKATGISMAKVATKVMLGQSIKDQGVPIGLGPKPKCNTLKAPVFSFNKLLGVEVGLGPEMKSTGEIMSFGKSLTEVFSKTWTSLGFNNSKIRKGAVLITVDDRDKPFAAKLAKRIKKLGYEIYATSGTYDFFETKSIEAFPIRKIHEGTPNLLNLLSDERISFVVNSVSGNSEAETDGMRIRAASVRNEVPLFTNLESAEAFVETLEFWSNEDKVFPVRALQDSI